MRSAASGDRGTPDLGGPLDDTHRGRVRLGARPVAAPDRSSNTNGGARTAVTVPNDRSAITDLGERFVREAGEAGYSEASCFAVRLALEEAVVNAFRHGHKDLDASIPVEVSYAVGPASIEISITDAGPGFDPASVPDPTAPENITKTSGRGLLLIRSYMTEVRHNDTGNRIEMRYDKPEA